MESTLVRAIATRVQARLNCKERGNQEWFDRHTRAIHVLVGRYLPSGAGFDAGTKIDLQRSTPDRLVFTTSFHHMDQVGGYAGWTDHTISCRPSFVHSVQLTISGRNRNDIKDHIHEAFHSALTALYVDNVDLSAAEVNTGS